MNPAERFTVLSSIGGECMCEEGLLQLLKRKATPICCIWFQPIPEMKIEQGIMKTIHVNRMIKAGFQVKILMADWFVQRKSKIDTLDKARTIGLYNIEMWKAAGMDLHKVELLWLSDELNHHPIAMDVARKTTMDEMIRTCGLEIYEPEVIPASEFFYPCIQVSAILCRRVDIWLLNVDNEIYAYTLPSLLKDPDFRNKANRGRTIFMEDEGEFLELKIRSAFCPPKVAGNPCLAYIEYVIFPWFGKFEVAQKEENGRNKTFANMQELIASYENGVIDCADVKLAFEKAIKNILQPVFSGNDEARALINALKVGPDIDIIMN
uniref:tyrosine--tRNA ligase n=1 Tax=Oryza meridionalis TaxID=40149 RepID=A0A0E0DYT7_9ORYZ